MKRKKGRCLAMALIAGILCFSMAVPPVWADELEDKLQRLQNQAAEQQKKTDAVQTRIDTISEQLRALQGEVDEADSAYQSAKQSLDATQGEIDRNQKLMDDTQKELDGKSKALEKRVRDIYMNGQISYIDVLFGASDFSDFMTRMDLLKRVIRYDYDLVNSVREDRAVLVSAREKLDKDKEVREKFAKDAKEKQTTLTQKKQNKDKLLDKMKYDKATSERAYEELRAASRQVEQMIHQSQYTVTPSGSGGMIWPVSGTITSEFGWRVHPITGDSRFHSGLDIAADYGTPIRAAASGTVIHAGWISGYGNAVIIDHGGGISTLYGHNQSLAVSEGQSVSQGQVIAYCGSTGNSTGPHCHFEVREGGQAVSPYGYL